MRGQYTRAELKKKVDNILELATSDKVLEELRAVLELPQSEQLAEASKRLSLENFAAQGLSIPEDTRISSRIFDEATGQSTVLGDNRQGMTVHLAFPEGGLKNNLKPEDIFDKKKLLADYLKNGWSACVCVGAGGCVGVGGGT